MIFVTGGTGFIGSHLLYGLVSSGKKVRALKRETSNTGEVLKIFSYYTENVEELFSQIEWINGDLLDYFRLEKQLVGIEEVYHCAAIVSFHSSKREMIIHNNVEGTANIVNASINNRVKKFCHLSSVAALGHNQNGLMINEQTNWVASKKNSSYSESKFFSEMEVWRGTEEGMDAVIVNPSIVLGPGNPYKGSAQLFKAVYNGLKFYTEGITGYVDVKDVVAAMMLLMNDANFQKCKNQRYILNSENMSYRDIFNQIADELNRPRPKYFASNQLLEFAWRGAAFLRLFKKDLFSITRETAAVANIVHRFDGSKITHCIGFEYLPVIDSIKQAVGYIKDNLIGKRYRIVW